MSSAKCRMGAGAAETGRDFLSVPAKAAGEQRNAPYELRLHRKENE